MLSNSEITDSAFSAATLQNLSSVSDEGGNPIAPTLDAARWVYNELVHAAENEGYQLPAGIVFHEALRPFTPAQILEQIKAFAGLYTDMMTLARDGGEEIKGTMTVEEFKAMCRVINGVERTTAFHNRLGAAGVQMHDAPMISADDVALLKGCAFRAEHGGA